ncbi:Ig-like domain-containing protein [Clostridium cellulovorans]|uniref:Mannosyl-glycoprotein endo-beta-N-acetylglucosaminidase n=2 Tax=Clostridium cellulovorans TaxID=1493 RepID=D9SKZ6_CLOC7|nr:Ig-like domain-containing protein [Clostridium cellulovorans]ADL53568.1 Mannosyl-glycoprotein endo-beta-N-acetylglucosaminidase [Clostridium cellulovorans 743B]BAV13191.1 beta-N-acetylglucosaminidase [Clostridium cellulovorans]
MIRKSKAMIIAVICAIGTATFVSYDANNIAVAEVSSVKAMVAQLSPIVFIDQPTDGIQMGKKDFTVSGWSLSSSGVKDVKVYINNVLVGNAIINGARPDVAKVYPGYPGSDKSGYSFVVSKDKLVKGINEVKVISTGNDGVATTRKISMNVPSLSNLVCVDTPINNSTVSNDKITIAGWALAQEGVEAVNVFVNGDFVGKAAYGMSRADVAKAFPLYDDSNNSGYSIEIPKSKFLGSTGVIDVEVVSKDKKTSRTQVKLNVKDNFRITTIDIPAINSIIQNQNVFVGGWAINPSGLQKVTISLNGKILGDATMVARPDVAKVYPNYKGVSNSGFNYSINKSLLLEGNNVITVEAIGVDGTKVSKNTNITYKAPVALTCIDLPYENSKINNTDFVVSGWALNPDGVKEVKVYVDGKYIKSATLGLSRPDVEKVNPGYINGANSGYKLVIDRNIISPGAHTVTVEAIGNTGILGKATRNITMNKPSSYIVADNFSGGINYNRSFNIVGWALSPSGVKAVNVYVDGNLFNTTKPSISRPDVDAAFPGYVGGTTSGYSLYFDINKVARGIRQITLEAIGNDGTITKREYKLTVNKPDGQTFIDTPINNQLVSSSSITVSGWALNATGISSVQIYLDNQLKANATVGLSRPDVGAAFASKNYTDANISGYSATLDTTGVLVGDHIIKVVAIGKDGTSCAVERTIASKGKVVFTNYANTLDYYVNLQVAKKPPIWLSSGSRPATRTEIYNEMNPNTSINDPNAVFMFMKLNFTEGINADNLNKTLTTAGVLQGKGQAFLNGGRAFNVNPIYLVSHALLETGYGKSQLSIGTTITEIADLNSPVYETFLENGVKKEYLVGYKMIKLPAPVTVYNMYGIGAFDDMPHFPNRPLITGTTAAYKNGWTTVDAAITGGAKWIGDGYINDPTFNQNTLYKMRWDFAKNWHQYATDVLWARKQTYNIAKLVNQMDNPVLEFDIPRFK